MTLEATDSVQKRVCPAPLDKNVKFTEIFSRGTYLNTPNFTRQPVWKSFWEAQFNGRTFLFFGKSWMALGSLLAFLYWTRIFDPPPKERLDKYWLNSPKFRILSAFHNPGKRPAFKISCLTYNTRYYRRGIDHPFGLNEWKDNLFKLQEQLIIEEHPGVQYPYVYRQFRQVSTSDPLLHSDSRRRNEIVRQGAPQPVSVRDPRAFAPNGMHYYGEGLERTALQCMDPFSSMGLMQSPFGFPMMPFTNNMFGSMGFPFDHTSIMENHFGDSMMQTGCHSSTMMVVNSSIGPDGKQHVEKYARSSASNSDRQVHEVKEAYTNSTSGVDKIAYERKLGDRGQRIWKERNRQTEELITNDEVLGMDRSDEALEQFNARWSREAAEALPVRAALPGIDRAPLASSSRPLDMRHGASYPQQTERRYLAQAQPSRR